MKKPYNVRHSIFDPNAKCRDCDQLIPAGEGRSTFDIGAMFLGKSAAVCGECWKKREAEKAMAECTLVEGGYAMIHIDPDDGWLGGRWHVHRDGACFAAHSYRSGAIQDAYNDLDAAQAENRTLVGWRCAYLGSDSG